MNFTKVVETKWNKSVADCSNEELYIALLEMVKDLAKEKESNEGKKKVFAESEIGVLDWAEIVRIDKVVVRPRVWDDNGTEKIKAYLRSMKVVIDDEDYEDMDEMEVDDDDMPF